MLKSNIFVVLLIPWMANISPLNIFVSTQGCPNSISKIVIDALSCPNVKQFRSKPSMTIFVTAAFLFGDISGNFRFMTECCIRRTGLDYKMCFEFVRDMHFCFNDQDFVYRIQQVQRAAYMNFGLIPYIRQCLDKNLEIPAFMKERTIAQANLEALEAQLSKLQKSMKSRGDKKSDLNRFKRDLV